MKNMKMKIISIFVICTIVCFGLGINAYADPTAEGNETNSSITPEQTEAPPPEPTPEPVVPTQAPPEPTPEPVVPTQAPPEPTPEPVVPTQAPPEPTPEPVVPTQAPVEKQTEAPKKTTAPVIDDDDDDSQQNTAGTTNNSNGPTQTSKPNTAVDRPKATINPNGSIENQTEATPKPSNYVTFATLNIQKNSLSQNLFLAGAACIAAGVIGIASMIVYSIVKKRRMDKTENGEIFAAIQEAEERQYAQNSEEDFEDYSSQEYEDAEYDDETYDDYEGHYYEQETEQYDEDVYYEEQEQYEETQDVDYEDDFEDYEGVDYSNQNQSTDYSQKKATYDTEEILRDALNYSDNNDEY